MESTEHGPALVAAADGSSADEPEHPLNHRVRGQMGRPLKPAVREAVLRMVAEKATAREISEVTGINRSTAREYLARARHRETASAAEAQPNPVTARAVFVRNIPAPQPPVFPALTCQFITGPKASPGQPCPMCGTPSVRGWSWCQDHLKLVFVHVPKERLPS